MPPPFEKADLRDELAERMAAALATLESAHKTTQAGATHEQAKPENDKDTRALEQSYLARGQAVRVDELRASLAEVRAMPVKAFAEGAPAALGALALVEEDGRATWVFLAPGGGGEKLGDGGEVTVVTPRSPLGRAILGKRTGDDADLTTQGRRRALDVLDVK
ncbi:MAG TPA: hypothetical protein VGM56_32215 [Byssovorax sp.]|jgi:transcription elongation GreA/GreB family factor